MMDKWHWKKQSSGETWALVTASDEMILYSWCDDCGEHGIAGTDEAFALIEVTPDFQAACKHIVANYREVFDMLAADGWVCGGEELYEGIKMAQAALAKVNDG